MILFPFHTGTDKPFYLAALMFCATIGPAAAATFTVTNAGDAGTGSLRQAILEANAVPGADLIAVAIPGAGPHQILPTSPLPAVTDPVVIDALTQPGADCSSWPPTLQVELDGTNLTGVIYGLRLSGGASTVRGLVINGFRDAANDAAGILIDSDGNTVECSFIGTDLTGTSGGFALRNEFGIVIDGAADNLIGGTAPAARNLISNSDEDGIRLRNGATGNVIAGNYIGTNAAGDGSIENGNSGVYVLGAPGNIIGGDDRGAGVCNNSCNLISGNDDNGIEIWEDGGDDTVIQGNFIGVDSSGTVALPNEDDGIMIDLGTGTVGHGGHLVGGATGAGVCSGPCNLIAGNLEHAIRVDDAILRDVTIRGNFIGTNATGDAAVPNGNGGLKIDGNDHLIGGSAPGLGNLISGNDGIGLELQGIGIVAQGNLIGTAIDGMTPLGNSDSGVRVTESGHLVGGTGAGEGNIIAYNLKEGIGHSRNVGAPTNARNSFLGNSIHANGLLGIDLGLNGPTGNDTGDGDMGENDLQNFPVLDNIPTTTGSGTTSVSGSLNSLADSDFRLEFFATEACDPSGFGEARTFIGTTTVTTNGIGDAIFDELFVTTGVPSGWVVTSTATRLGSGGEPLDTSELSQCAPLSGSSVVTTTAEDGPGSLAAAIEFANASNGTDVISFDINSASDPNCNAGTGVCILQGSQPPTITSTVLIDGLTQPGASCNAWPPTLKIQIEGRLILEGNASLARGVSVFAISLDGTNHTVRCSFVGTEATGTAPIPDFGGGVFTVNGSGHMIGGVSETDRNLISGHTSVGMRIASSGSVVQGNFIGTDVTGMNSLPNAFRGVQIVSAIGGAGGAITFGGTEGTTPGGPCTGACNLVSGNANTAIEIASVSGVTVAGNLVGTDVTGAAPLPNLGTGLLIRADDNILGGIDAGAANTIAHNGDGGVIVRSGAMEAGTGNRILRNIVHSNAGPGIDLSDDGISANDAGDADEGANRLQNTPEIASVTGDDESTLTIAYLVPSETANSAYPLRIEFFLADADGEEGARFLGADSYAAGEAGQQRTVMFSPVSAVQDGDLVLATATDADGNTSEFSGAVASVGGAASDSIFADRFEGAARR